MLPEQLPTQQAQLAPERHPFKGGLTSAEWQEMALLTEAALQGETEVCDDHGCSGGTFRPAKPGDAHGADGVAAGAGNSVDG